MSATETATAAGAVVVREYSLERARAAWPDWDDLDRSERHGRLRDLEPDAESHHRNAVQDEWHQHVVDILDQSQSPSTEEISHFAVGTDGTQPTTADGGLLAEVYRTQIDTQDDQGKDLVVSGFLDSTEANGNTLRETGLFTGAAGTGELPFNRALIAETTKTDTKLVTIDFTLKFRDA